MIHRKVLLLNIIKKLANCIAKSKFASKAIDDRADLREIND